MTESKFLDINNPEFARISAHFIRFLFSQQKRNYPDALLFGSTFPVSLAIEARQRFTVRDPTFTSATCVSDHMLGSPRLRKMTDTPFAPEDFVFSLRWRRRQEYGNFDLSGGELQGYIDAVVLYVAATEWFIEDRPQMALSAIIANWPAFNALDDSVRQQSTNFIATNEAWAKRVVVREDVIEGRSFMDKLVVEEETAAANAARSLGIRTARDTLLVYTVLLTTVLTDKLELIEASNSEDINLTIKALELIPDGDPRLKGPSLMFLGDTAMKDGRQDLAIDAYSEAIPLFDAADEGEDATTCCLALGNAFLEKADNNSAERWILEAERRMREQGRFSDLPTCEATLAQVRLKQRRTDDALAFLHRAQEGFRKYNKTSDALKCVALELELFGSLGCNEKAENLFESLDEDDKAEIVAKHGASLALLRIGQGRIDEAASLFSNTLQEAILNKDLYLIPGLQCNLAYTRYLQGRLKESLALVEEAREQYERAGLLDEVWDCSTKSALFMVAQGKLTDAISVLSQLQKDKEKVGSVARAEVDYLLAQILLQQSPPNIFAAENAINQAISDFTKGNRPDTIPHCLRLKGEIQRKQGKLDVASRLILEALARHEANNDLDNANNCRYELAIVYRDMANVAFKGNREKAQSLALQAVQLLREIRSTNGIGGQARDTRLAWHSAGLQAMILREHKDGWVEALKLFQEVIAQFDLLWPGQAIIDDRLTVGDVRLSSLLNAAVLALKLGNRATAYELFVDAKGREGREALGNKYLSSAVDSLPDAEHSTLKNLLAQEEKYRMVLDSNQQSSDINTMLDRAFANTQRSPEKAAAYAALSEIRREIQVLLKNICEKYPWGGSLVIPQKVTINDIKAALREDEVLLDYLVYEKNAYVFVVNKSSAVDVFMLDSEYINKTYFDLNQAIDDGIAKQQPYHLEPDLLARISGAFIPAELVLLQPLLKKAKVILISPPNSSFGRVPWTFMAANGFLTGCSIKPVGVIPSASWLPLVRSPYLGKTARTNRAWVVASHVGPDYPLPNQANFRARRIADIYGAVQNEGHIEATAPGSYEAIRDMPAVAVLHITTHGYIDKIKGAKIFLLNRDGVKHEAGPEVFWESKADAPLIAVLSVCWSASTAGHNYGEWMGLSTSLLTKGAQAVIVCCWPVNYFTAELLFYEMHRHWAAGVPIGVALNIASDWLCKQTSMEFNSLCTLNKNFAKIDRLQATATGKNVRSSHSDPFHLAVFVLLGDPTICRPKENE